ncbi:MAG: hypothetical protein LAT68_11400 [Cyclobacteriaceae bacterium]|nr:hypothetical protein [Cyclobacteriaceae bacterium]
MQKGLISKGNGHELAVILKEFRIKDLEFLLQKWINDAKRNRCGKILISAEALVHELVKKDRLQLLEETTKKLGIHKVSCMGYFREMVDHCLSTFKHRGKSGKIQNFEDWVVKVYETPKLLVGFLKLSSDYPFTNQFYYFKKDSRYLLGSFFEEWLQVKSPLLSKIPRVNDSLTLSEIQVLIQLKSVYPHTLDQIAAKFKKLSKEAKANDENLELSYRENAYNLLKDQKNNFEAFEQLIQFREDEPFFHLVNSGTSLEKGEYSLSYQQLNALAEGIHENNSIKGKLRAFKRKLTQK